MRPPVRRPPPTLEASRSRRGAGPARKQTLPGPEWGLEVGGWLHQTLQCGGGNRFPFVLFASTAGAAGVVH